MEKYDENIRGTTENYVSNTSLPIMIILRWNQLSWDNYYEDFQKAISDETIKDVDEYFDINDKYISMKVGVPRGHDDEL